MSRRIPNRFHFVFGLTPQTEPFHLAYYLCLESCRVVNRPESITLYYHYEPYGPYWDLIKKHLCLVRVDLNSFVARFTYRERGTRRYAYAHHSDFIRLEKLLAEGGVYADIDTLFVNEIPPKLFEQSFVLGREDDIISQTTGRRSRSLCNAFIMSEKGSEFGRMWLDDMAASFDGSWSNHSTLLPQRLSEEQPELIHIEPARTFYKHMWTREGIRMLFEGCDADTSGVVSLHLWSHLWWSDRRRDFSEFSGGMLTEKYVRTADTTYAVLARRFLPAHRPKLLFISPVMPRPTGEGRSMRAHRVLCGLASKYEVDLLVAESGLRSLVRGTSRLRNLDRCGPWRNITHHPRWVFSDVSLTIRSLCRRIAPQLVTHLFHSPADWYPLTLRMRNILRTLAQAEDYAVIHVFRLYMAPLGLFLHRMKPRARLELDLDDLESLTRRRIAELQRSNGELQSSLQTATQSRAYRKAERRTLTQFGRVFVCSKLDRERLRQSHGIENAEIIPNTVLPLAVAMPRLPQDGSFTFLFVGTMSYYPNRDAVKFFCECVMPRLRSASAQEIVFRIIGEGADRHIEQMAARVRGVELVGPVRSMAGWYETSDGVVVPLRAGGGTRIKVLEAFAHSKPVVSTSLGVEGIPVRDGVHVLLADSEGKLAEQCARLANDAALGEALAANALELLRSECNTAYGGLLG